MNAIDRIDEIFWEAAQIAAGDERDAYLAGACEDDPALLQRVQKLLQAQSKVEQFLERPFAGPAAGAELPTACEGPGSIIGPYKLLEQIGEGGMGLVFMAEQEHPVRRRVALKIVKPGMDTKQVVARFEAERQALALMDHPNIAKVHDAGESPPAYAGGSPRPYFVMELVRGVPITDFCDQHRLDTRRRLALFVQVCRAVQHAHQKGVIHRDLKPGNVLVTLHDTVPVPKVIDFGIAKATTGQRLTERTLFTHFVQMVGTPLYMSPEQAEMNGLDVDTRSDVYSLGVLLYELLTGTTPFESETLKQVGFDEMRRLIREEEPPAPSRRLSTLAAGRQSTVSERRGVDGRRLGQMLRGELDWVVMRALEKDRNRRYESASALAADVERYLADEPVEAGPPSTVYRLRKHVRRNRRLLVVAGLFAITLVAATAVSTWQAIRAREAQAQAEKDRTQAEASERTAMTEAAIAKAVNDFLQTGLLKPTDPEVLDRHGYRFNPNLTVREALDRAAATIEERFSDQPLVEAAIRATISQAYSDVGEPRLALLHAQRSLALYEKTLDSADLQFIRAMDRLATAQAHAAQHREAVELARKALELRTAQFGPDHPETLTGMFNLATTYGDAGHYAEAIELCQRMVAKCEAVLGRDHATTERAVAQLAESYAKGGRWAQCTAILEPSLEKSKATHGLDNPKSISLMDNIARCYANMGRLEEALQIRETLVASMGNTFGAEHDKTLGGMLKLARVYLLTGRLEKADRLLHGILPMARRLSQIRGTEKMSATLELMSQNLLLQHRYFEAEPFARELLTSFEKHYPDYWYRFNAMSILGGALLGQQKYSEAEPLLLRGYEGMRERQETIWRDRLTRLTDAAERLVRFYEVTNQPEKARAVEQGIRAITPTERRN